MAKQIKLNISERLKATTLLNEFKGQLDKLAIILEDIKKVTISAEELNSIEGKVVNNPDGSQSLFWNKEKEELITKEITLGNITVKYLKGRIAEKDKNNEFGIGDLAILTLNEKLNEKEGSEV